MSFRILCIAMLVCAFTMCRKRSIDAIPIDVPVFTNSHVLVADTQKINEAFGGYYIALPACYSDNTKRYPLIVFLHGLGQRGNGKEELKYLLFDGMGKVIKDM